MICKGPIDNVFSLSLMVMASKCCSTTLLEIASISKCNSKYAAVKNQFSNALVKQHIFLAITEIPSFKSSTTLLALRRSYWEGSATAGDG